MLRMEECLMSASNEKIGLGKLLNLLLSFISLQLLVCMSVHVKSHQGFADPAGFCLT